MCEGRSMLKLLSSVSELKANDSEMGRKTRWQPKVVRFVDFSYSCFIFGEQRSWV
jgi:hypothetical protein